jgi:hypothetical protein
MTLLKLAKQPIVLWIALLLFGHSQESSAFWQKESEELVTINGIRLSSEDYIHWWSEWREKDSPVPDDLSEFIDWMLLFQEADRMRLYESPAYRRKVRVFLKVRSLMQLKHEEVNERIIQPFQEDLWNLYQKDYAPVFKMRLLRMTSGRDAEAFKTYLAEGVSLRQATERAGLKKTLEPVSEIGPVRPKNLPPPLRQAAAGLAENEVGGPEFWQGYWFFVEVMAKESSSREDFEAIKNKLSHELIRNQEDQLTSELIKHLKIKYSVEVDQQLLMSIGPDGVKPEKKDKPVMRFDGGDVTAETFYNACAKEHRLRSAKRRGGMDFSEIRQRVLADMIAQTVTGKEALSRRYERKAPFKYTYEFYCQRRMIIELENVVLHPAIAISEKDIKDEYERTAERYCRGETVEVAIVQTREDELAENLEERLKTGEDFFEVMRPLSPSGIATQRIPFDHLIPIQREAINHLSPGQVSGALRNGQDIYFIKLIRREKQELIPLEKLTGQIRDRLTREKFETARRHLVDTLTDRSIVKINSASWKTLRSRLLREKDAD